MIKSASKWTTTIACLVASTTAALAVDRPAITSVSHLSVYTSDPVKTEHFYVHDLGAAKGSDPQNPQGVRYYFNSIQFFDDSVKDMKKEQAAKNGKDEG